MASMALLNTTVLDFGLYEWASAECLLRPDTLLSLPAGVTQLVLSNFDQCVPAVALPENILTRYTSSPRLLQINPTTPQNAP